MLPAKYRLTKKIDFNVAKSRGKAYHGTSLTLIVLKRNDNLNSKIGFIVSKKISKKAVERNRIKRILREIIKDNLENINNGYNILVLTKKRMLGMDKIEIKKELNELLEKIKLM